MHIITDKELNRRLNGAAALLVKTHGKGKIPPESLKKIGKEFFLPIGDDIDNDVVAQTVVVAAFAPEATDALKKGRMKVKALLERRTH